MNHGAIDDSPGFVHDVPAPLAFPVFGGQGLTLLIGDGNRQVEMACDDPWNTIGLPPLCHTLPVGC